MKQLSSSPRHAATRRLGLGILCALFAAGLGGCASSGHLFASPKVRLTEAAVTGFSREGADLLLDFDVTNPNHLRLPLRGVDYRVRVNGERFLTGSESRPMDIPAQGAVRLSIPVSVRYDDFVKALKSLAGRSHPMYDIEADFRFAVPLMGTIKVPVHERREIPLPELRLNLSDLLSRLGHKP